MFLFRACAYLSLLGNRRQYCKKGTFEQGRGKVEEAENRGTKLERNPSFRLFSSLCTQLESNDACVPSQFWSYRLGFFFLWAGGTSQVLTPRQHTYQFGSAFRPEPVKCWVVLAPSRSPWLRAEGEGRHDRRDCRSRATALQVIVVLCLFAACHWIWEVASASFLFLFICLDVYKNRNKYLIFKCCS